jgi:hypothetical protein
MERLTAAQMDITAVVGDDDTVPDPSSRSEGLESRG